MTKTNELLPNHHPVEEIFYHENYPQSKIKNKWGCWIEKPTDQEKYICNSCLKKNLLGRFDEQRLKKHQIKQFCEWLAFFAGSLEFGPLFWVSA
ncbi:hypothetical protein [endosymbiont GvMRE of Glomus versiforme]|uniref:hypothetical protein n=1 Tax=endosymbiont GvMRE of Glomus versiforme TaxID=2039283 RepID=UPI0011C3F040|nr:hypothetical protein [endosymbiont GvMRE of Glomus versiforme]